jgi:predicted DsbA family dithiol-disulfide isomerase
MQFHIDIYSDAICPWCFIGKRRLEHAMQIMERQHIFTTTWRPFQLNPNMPKGGMDRKVYRTAKFGSWNYSQVLDAQAATAGAREGIPFAFEQVTRTPNTFDAHRLIWLAYHSGVQDQVVEEIFHTYFLEGKDVGNREVLETVARRADNDGEQMVRLFESDAGTSEVQGEEARAGQLGIRGVPYFIINGAYALSGAQDVSTLVNAFTLIDQRTQQQLASFSDGDMCSENACTLPTSGEPACSMKEGNS